jgi:capsular polysaccharide biosynthesis protein
MVRIVLLRLLESYFRHRWLYVLPVVIAVAAGAAFVSTRPPEYMASGRLYVSQQNLLADLTSSNTSGSWWVSAAQSTVSELNELVGTQAFIRTVIQKTDLEKNMSGGSTAVEETITYARKILSIQAVGEKLVDISATSDDPNVAYQIVVSTMDAYVQWKINNGYQESIAARSFFDDLIKPYQDDVNKAREELGVFLTAHPQPVRGDRPPVEQLEVDRLQTAVQRAEDRLNSALDNEESARLGQAKSESVTKQTYMVIDQPQMPQDAKVSVKTIATNMAIFLVVGIFLAAAGVASGALLDRSLRFPIDVRHGLSLPVLAMVPIMKPIILAVAPAEQAAPAPAPATTTDESSKPDEAVQSDPSVLQPQV